MEKSKIIFLGVVAIVGILVVYFLVSFISGDSATVSESDFYVPDVVKTDSKENYKSRLEKANSLRNPKSDNPIGSNADFKIYQSDSIINPVDSIPNKTKENPKNKPRIASRASANPSKSLTRNVAIKEKTVQPQVSNTSQNTSNDTIQPKPSNPTGGFGIVRNVNIPQQPEKNDPTNSFFPVMLENAYTVKDNSNIVFVLLSDIYLDGILFSKNSFAFGKAKLSNHYFDVSIYQIKNTDGKMYNVDYLGLHIFDENYSRGFKFEGNIDEGVKEGALEGVASTSVSSYGVVDAGARVVDRVISNVTRKKEPSVSLLRGYRIYLKPTNN